MPVNENDIKIAAGSAIRWLRLQNPDSPKDLSRSIQALSSWKEDATEQIELLLSLQRNGHWADERQVPDTARASIALASCSMREPESIRWILDHQANGNWNNNEIDTSYALIALSDNGIRNAQGCEWLLKNYGPKWEHVGTTSLIITALKLSVFVKETKGRHLVVSGQPRNLLRHLRLDFGVCPFKTSIPW